MRKILVPFVALSSVLLGYLMPHVTESAAAKPGTELACADREPTSIHADTRSTKEGSGQNQPMPIDRSSAPEEEPDLDDYISKLAGRLAEKCKSDENRDSACETLTTLASQNSGLANLARQLADELRAKCEIDEDPDACRWSGNFYFILGMRDQLLDMDRAACNLNSSFQCDDLVAQLGYQNHSEEEQFEAAKLGCEVQSKYDLARDYCDSIMNQTHSPALFQLLKYAKIDGMPLLRKPFN